MLLVSRGRDSLEKKKERRHWAQARHHTPNHFYGGNCAEKGKGREEEKGVERAHLLISADHVFSAGATTKEKKGEKGGGRKAICKLHSSVAAPVAATGEKRKDSPG